jgi:hypothetical protein
MKSLRTVFAAAILLAAFQQPSRASDPSTAGSWTQPFDLPLISMHASLLPTGKVLLYSAEHGVPGVQVYVLDPMTLGLTEVPPPVNWIPACSGHSFLADGRLLVTGGQIGTEDPPLGTTECNIFDPFTLQWVRIEDTRRGRWYASNITLGDGRIVTFSGLDQYSDFNPDIELWDPRGTNNWQYLGERLIDYYPHLHLLTNGLIFRAGPNDSGQTDTYNVTNDVWTYIATRKVGGRFDCPANMVPPNPNRIMIMGGQESTNQPNNTVEIIDLSSPSPQWTYTTPMHFARMDFNSVILPNGKVLVVGGRANFAPEAIYVFTPEVYDPQNATWTTLATNQIPRWYHSTAILLPDGRVLSAGSDDQPTGEIFSPPYLFQGTRPVIQSAPRIIQYGQSFSLSFTSTTTTNRVALIRNSCATHSVNMEQRYVFLADLTNGSGTFTVSGPAYANLAPPGYYMLYVVNQNGVPSVSTMVHVLGEPLQILETRRTGNSLQFFWSMNFAHATLQTASSLRPPVTWTSQPGTPTIQEGRYTLILSATTSPTFFRLNSP